MLSLDTLPPCSESPDHLVLAANIDALATYCGPTAERLRTVELPPSTRSVVGRDGNRTFVWSDAAGRLEWLGRTSIPTVRAEELIAAFEPGSRNVLLRGVGSGEEIRLLLGRLAPYQAVFVLEEDPAVAALVLRLRDFSGDLRRGRLVILVAGDVWGELKRFLCDHPGFLTPERVLCWPWFAAADVAAISDQLSSVNSVVAASRNASRQELRSGRLALEHVARSRAIAVVSNVADWSVLEFAARLRHAAGIDGFPCETAVLDCPACVHPDAVERKVWEAKPSHVVLLDVLPDGLQCALPKASTMVSVSHQQPLAAEWLGRLPDDARLVVMTAEQHEQAVSAGVSPDRVVLLRPAATPGLGDLVEAGRKGLIVVADGPDASPEAVGLHLSSHVALWSTAKHWIERHVGDYTNERAEEVLAAAEAKLGIRLTSDEVRQGLIVRIREVLGPAVIGSMICQRLLETGREFDLYGSGWEHDARMAQRHGGRWPLPSELVKALAGRGLAIIVGLDGGESQPLLDCAAAGLVTFARSQGMRSESAFGAGRVLDPARDLVEYCHCGDLMRLLNQAETAPQMFEARAARAAEYVNSAHTWVHRLRGLLGEGQRA